MSQVEVVEPEAQPTPRIPRDTFAARLVLMRHELKLTVEKAAHRCEIPSATWSSWERGVEPRGKEQHVRTIAEKLGYDKNWLMWGSNSRWTTTADLLDVSDPDPDAQPSLPFPPPLVLAISTNRPGT